jgi:hypothetical protein
VALAVAGIPRRDWDGRRVSSASVLISGMAPPFGGQHGAEMRYWKLSPVPPWQFNRRPGAASP